MRYEEPYYEIVRLEKADIITSSLDVGEGGGNGPGSGFGDNDNAEGKFGS